MTQANQNKQHPQKGKQQPQKPQQQAKSPGKDNTRNDKLKKRHEQVDRGALVFQLELTQTVIGSQMFKSNDYMFNKLSKQTGLGTKSAYVSGDALRILDYKRYEILLLLHEMNQELSALSDTEYKAPNAFHESISLEEVRDFLAKNKVSLGAKKEKVVEIASAPAKQAPAKTAKASTTAAASAAA